MTYEKQTWQDLPAGGTAVTAARLNHMEDGIEAADASPGADGASAYEVAVANGFVGNEAAWLASLEGAAGTPGADGDSAYEVAVANGFVGTEEDWLISLEGDTGSPGPNGWDAYRVAQEAGFVGTEEEWLASLVGPPGADGADGDSAYEVAVANGFVGNEAAWLASLEGAAGTPGADGDSAYEVAVANGFVGNEAAWLASLEGAAGTPGADGASAYEVAVANGFVGNEAAWLASLEGAAGTPGADGDSAYEVAVANGFVGTEEDWLISLEGDTGSPGPNGWDAYRVAQEAGFVGTEEEWLASLVGPPGADGADGDSAYEVAVANGFVGNEAAWLASLEGAAGTPGADGDSAYEVAVANGFVGNEAAWLASLEGAAGTPGADGDSAYEVAVANGFVGNEAAWLASLEGAAGTPGADGDSAYEVAVANGFVGNEAAWLASLEGAAGTPGADGDSAYEVAVANGFVGTEAAWLASLEGPQGEMGPVGTDAPDWTTITSADDIDFNAGMQALELDEAWAPDFINVPLDPTPGQITLFVNVTGSPVITWPSGTIWMNTAPTPTDGEWFLVEFATRSERVLAWNLGSGDEPPPFPDSPTPLWNAFGWYLNYEAALISNVADGAALSQWREPKRGWHLEMPLAGSQPTYRASYANINGRAAVEGDGVADYIRRYGLTLAQPYSLVAVVASDVADYAGTIVGTGVISNARGLGASSTSSGRWRMHASNTNEAGGQPTISVPHLVEAYVNGTSSYLKVDGITVVQGIDPGTAALDQISLFAGYDGTAAGFWDGAISAVGVYEGDHEVDAGWAAVRSEIVTYYGISYTNTPSGSNPSANIAWSADYNADSSAAANGAAVEAYWRDDSGNGRHAWQDFASARPLMVSSVAALNNQKAFDFDGTDDFFFHRRTTSLTAPWSCLLVIVADVVDSAQRIIGTNDSSSARGVGFGTGGTGQFAASLGGTGTLASASSSAVNGTAYLIEFYSNGASSQMWVNGTSVAGPATAGSSPAVNIIALGAGMTNAVGSDFYNGRLACAKFLNGSNHRDHANYATEIAAIKSKYGFVY